MNVDKEQELIERYGHLLDPEFASWKNGLGFIQVTDGWTHIIEAMFETLDDHRNTVEQIRGKSDFATNYTEPFDIKISTIKEKFSSLRVYYTVNDEHKQWTAGVIHMATEMAARTCECCGTVDKSVIGMTTGWLTVICKPCYDKKAAALEPEWKTRHLWITREEARERFGRYHKI